MIELFFEGFRSSDLDRWAEGHLIEDLPWSGIHIPALDTPIDLRGKGKQEFLLWPGDYVVLTK